MEPFKTGSCAVRAAGTVTDPDAAQLVRLARASVADMRIDLSGAVVVTEAATGAYAVTPVIAALSGARHVYAFTRASRHGTVAEVMDQTFALAVEAGVANRIEVRTDRPVAVAQHADVITNSGHVRPIDAELVSRMRPGAVLSLMFEAWEVQAGRFDLDLAGAIERGIAVAGTNERHPVVDVFPQLGPMAVRLLADAGTDVAGARVAVLCDNPFRCYLETGLSAAGAAVASGDDISDIDPAFRPDAVLIALTPTGSPVVGGDVLDRMVRAWPAAVVAQFWGDIDRGAMDRLGIRYWPPVAPGPGHMAVLPSDVGPEPIVRLQAGGLKVASVLRTPPDERSAFDLEFLDEL